jgi:hypothetical protein
MSLRTELDADLVAACADYEDSFEWAGSNYACVRRNLADAHSLVDGGFLSNASGSLVVPKSAFAASFPQIGDLIDSGTFQITSIDGANKSTAPQLIIYFGDPDAA